MSIRTKKILQILQRGGCASVKYYRYGAVTVTTSNMGMDGENSRPQKAAGGEKGARPKGKIRGYLII